MQQELPVTIFSDNLIEGRGNSAIRGLASKHDRCHPVDPDTHVFLRKLDQ
jgi:hypothetical protein